MQDLDGTLAGVGTTEGRVRANPKSLAPKPYTPNPRTREKEREARRREGSEPSGPAPLRSMNATLLRRAASISSTTSPTALCAHRVT